MSYAAPAPVVVNLECLAHACSPQVHDTPEGHVTRDYKEGLARLSDLRFKVVDTSGGQRIRQLILCAAAGMSSLSTHGSDLRSDFPSAAGLEPTAAAESIQARATALTAGILNQSTLALFLLDARSAFATLVRCIFV